MTRQRAKWLFAGLHLLVSVAPLAAAGETEARAAIASLLDVGWANTPQARIAADEQYQRVLSVAGTDPRALSASWLVLMHQRRYEEALKRIDEHLAKAPEDLSVLRAKAWVQTILKNYSAAMSTADKLSSHLAARPPTSEAGHAERNELILFLGRLAGYLGGPAADSVNQEDRKLLEKKFMDRLDDAGKIEFGDARNGVLSRFVEMSDDSAEARERASAVKTAEKEKTLAELHADHEQATARTKELEDRKTKLQDEFKAELDEIAKQDQPLIQELARLSARSTTLNNELAGLQAQTLALQQAAAAEKNVARQQQLLLQANSLSLIAARVDANLLATSRLAQGVQAQRAGLAARQTKAQANTASQVERIDRELAGLAKRERRNDGLEKRTARSVTTISGKVRSLSAQATALSTYDPFPLEAAKARLLEALR